MNHPLTVSDEVYKHMRLAKDDGQSFDSYLRQLLGIQQRPAKPLVEREKGARGRPVSELFKKIRDIPVKGAITVPFELTEPRRDKDGEIVEFYPAANAGALQGMIKRVERATGYTYHSEGTVRGLVIYRRA